MSTSATITVGTSGILIYKHWDGYKEGVLPWLVPFVREFMAKRGMDSEYMLARILERGIKVTGDSDNVTGWGLTTSDAYCADFEYTVKQDGRVSVKDRDGNVSEFGPDDELGEDVYADKG